MKNKTEEKANEKNMIEDIANEKRRLKETKNAAIFLKWMAAQFPDP